MLATKQQALPRVVISQRRRVRIHALDEQDVGVAAPKEDEAFSFGPNSRSGELQISDAAFLHFDAQQVSGT